METIVTELAQACPMLRAVDGIKIVNEEEEAEAVAEAAAEAEVKGSTEPRGADEHKRATAHPATDTTQ
jgi:hypothetical protein